MTFFKKYLKIWFSSLLGRLTFFLVFWPVVLCLFIAGVMVPLEVLLGDWTYTESFKYFFSYRSLASLPLFYTISLPLVTYNRVTISILFRFFVAIFTAVFFIYMLNLYGIEGILFTTYLSLFFAASLSVAAEMISPEETAEDVVQAAYVALAFFTATFSLAAGGYIQWEGSAYMLLVPLVVVPVLSLFLAQLAYHHSLKEKTAADG